MNLSLNNIGKIKNANINIDGITIIAGENDTGKSTISRVIYSLFDSLHNIDNRMNKEQFESIESILISLYRSSRLFSREHIETMTNDIIKNIEKYKVSQDNIRSYFTENNIILENYLDSYDIDKLILDLFNCLNVSKEDIITSLVEKQLNAEFSGQIQNIYNPAHSQIHLTIEDTQIFISIDNNNIVQKNDWPYLHTEVFYIDDPTILDEPLSFNLRNNSTHRNRLRRLLFNKQQDSNIVDEIVKQRKLEHIYALISKVCNGNVVRMNPIEYGYRLKAKDPILNVKNLSAGLKTFVILKTLLLNGSIKSGSIIILDEPEIHLHPEWQLIFAELIVLLHKEFNIQILLNTHSHYFLDAIEVYSNKYGISNKCKYYLATTNGTSAQILDVSENTEEIYKKLVRPLQKLENERYNNNED